MLCGREVAEDIGAHNLLEFLNMRRKKTPTEQTCTVKRKRTKAVDPIDVSEPTTPSETEEAQTSANVSLPPEVASSCTVFLHITILALHTKLNTYST